MIEAEHTSEFEIPEEHKASWREKLKKTVAKRAATHKATERLGDGDLSSAANSHLPHHAAESAGRNIGKAILLKGGATVAATVVMFGGYAALRPSTTEQDSTPRPQEPAPALPLPKTVPYTVKRGQDFYKITIDQLTPLLGDTPTKEEITPVHARNIAENPDIPNHDRLEPGQTVKIIDKKEALALAAAGKVKEVDPSASKDIKELHRLIPRLVYHHEIPGRRPNYTEGARFSRAVKRVLRHTSAQDLAKTFSPHPKTP